MSTEGTDHRLPKRSGYSSEALLGTQRNLMEIAAIVGKEDGTRIVEIALDDTATAHYLDWRPAPDGFLLDRGEPTDAAEAQGLADSLWVIYSLHRFFIGNSKNLPG